VYSCERVGAGVAYPRSQASLASGAGMTSMDGTAGAANVIPALAGI